MPEAGSAKVMESLNRETMASDEAVGTYRNYLEITAPERVAFDLVADEVRGRPILDLGVGGGRTVEALTRLSAEYTGLDYTLRMIEACQRRYPGLRFVHGDARDLSRYRDGAFHLVVFSCNGLCMVGHEDRLQILAEVRRVLDPGGVFIFSSHNQQSADHDEGFVYPEFEWSWNPVRAGVRMIRFAASTIRRARNHRRLRHHDFRGPEYSIINDRCHDYATMLYYISAESQRRQLAAAGFAPDPLAYDLKGELVGAGTTAPSILYIARR